MAHHPGAFVAHGNIVLASNASVVVSSDDGATYAAVPSGDTTADQVRGTGLAMDAEMTLYLTQAYGVRGSVGGRVVAELGWRDVRRQAGVA